MLPTLQCAQEVTRCRGSGKAFAGAEAPIATNVQLPFRGYRYFRKGNDETQIFTCSPEV